MKAEYFPPKEDVILQNEAPTDLYILVTGSAVRTKIPLRREIVVGIKISLDPCFQGRKFFHFPYFHI